MTIQTKECRLTRPLGPGWELFAQALLHLVDEGRRLVPERRLLCLYLQMLQFVQKTKMVERYSLRPRLCPCASQDSGFGPALGLLKS